MNDFLTIAPETDASAVESRENPSLLTRTVPAYRTVHRLPGRLRLSVPRLGHDPDYPQRLRWALRQAPGIESHRVNPAARVLIVTYTPDGNSEAEILAIVEKSIERASEKNLPGPPETPRETGLDLTATFLVLSLALLANPLEIPLFFCGTLVLLTSLPLWKRIGTSFQEKGEITPDTLDGVWLLLQLLQGNPLAGSLALNLNAIGENVRGRKLEKLAGKLPYLGEREAMMLPGRENLASRATRGLETTGNIAALDSLARASVIPTLVLSGAIAIGTGDLARASALLPLDLGVTLRGTMPLAIASALVAAAERGVYIRDGEVLERLSSVDTLVLRLETYRSLPGASCLDVDIHLIAGETPDEGEKFPPVHVIPDRSPPDRLFEELHREGRVIAWLEDGPDDFPGDGPDIILAFDGRAGADALLRERDLRAVEDTLSLARHTFTTAGESLTIALLPNLLAVGAGVIFALDPLVAVSINGGAAILSELYSSRPPSFGEAGIEKETEGGEEYERGSREEGKG